MLKRTPVIILSSLVAVLLVVGCGGDSALTKAEFIEQADVICRKAEEEKASGIQKYVLEIGVGPTKRMTHAQEEHQTKTVVLPPIRDAVKQISELGAPDGDEATIEGLVKNLEAASDESAELSEKKNPKYQDPFVGAAKEAREYGFKTCFVHY